MEIISLSKVVSKTSLASFDCGESVLNQYLVNYASQNERRQLTRSYVALENGEVLGFYSLCSTQISIGDFPTSLLKHYPSYLIPAVKIARLGVGKTYQGRGIGTALLSDAIKKASLAASYVGTAFVVVDAKEKAVGFYKKLGFTPLPSQPCTLVYSLKSIKAY